MGLENFIKNVIGKKESVAPKVAVEKIPEVFNEENEIKSFSPNIAVELLKIKILHRSEQELKRQITEFYAKKENMLGHLNDRAKNPNDAETIMFNAWTQEQLRISNEESAVWEKLNTIMRSESNEINLKYNDFRRNRTVFLKNLEEQKTA